MTKLYNVPQDTMCILPDPLHGVPITFKFHHIDGMYSLCTDEHGNTFHLQASTEVNIIEEPK